MDDGSPIPRKEDELADDAFTSVFPHGLPPAKPSAGCAIVRSFPLDQTHVAQLHVAHAEGTKLNVTNDTRQRMSRRHHRLAQLLSNGMEPGRAGVLCGLAGSTVSILQGDPLFQELMEHYSSMVDESFRTVVEEMAELHLDVVETLKTRLEENPANFTPTQLTDLLKALSDRTGNGPTTTTNNRSLTVSLTGNDLARIKAGAALNPEPQSGLHGSARVQPQASVGTAPSIPNLPTVQHAPALRQAGKWEGEGVSVGAEGSRPRDEVVSPTQVALPRVD